MEMNKLIQHLRFCGDLEANCHECERYYEMGADGGTASCVIDLMRKAADVLEEQQKRIAELEETLDYARTIEAEGIRLKSELERLKDSNRWIPVTEPPKKRGCYFVVVKHWLDGNPVAREAYWNGADWLSCDRIVELTPRVTRWMPLPELPKEGA